MGYKAHASSSNIPFVCTYMTNRLTLNDIITPEQALFIDGNVLADYIILSNLFSNRDFCFKIATKYIYYKYGLAHITEKIVSV